MVRDSCSWTEEEFFYPPLELGSQSSCRLSYPTRYTSQILTKITLKIKFAAVISPQTLFAWKPELGLKLIKAFQIYIDQTLFCNISHDVLLLETYLQPSLEWESPVEKSVFCRYNTLSKPPLTLFLHLPIDFSHPIAGIWKVVVKLYPESEIADATILCLPVIEHGSLIFHFKTYDAGPLPFLILGLKSQIEHAALPKSRSAVLNINLGGPRLRSFHFWPCLANKAQNVPFSDTWTLDIQDMSSYRDHQTLIQVTQVIPSSCISYIESRALLKCPECQVVDGVRVLGPSRLVVQGTYKIRYSHIKIKMVFDLFESVAIYANDMSLLENYQDPNYYRYLSYYSKGLAIPKSHMFSYFAALAPLQKTKLSGYQDIVLRLIEVKWSLPFYEWLTFNNYEMRLVCIVYEYSLFCCKESKYVF
ncbi:hypothetical protein nvc1_062 [Namao virus]|nr:hypothetical protein nvc1_062 [Namao virus]